jgi:DNA-binding response OmpR family regulator
MGAHIVVIEDSELIRRLLSSNLNVQGYQVFSFDYASTEFSAVVRLNPDLVILDFSMRNDENAWNFLQLLRMEPATAHVPVLILTTSLDFSAEVNGYLSTRYIRVVRKPFEIVTFLHLVHQTLMMASQSGVIFSSDRLLPILVVDDSDDYRDAVVTVLSLEGYQVVTADNGIRALEAVYDAEHCLIFLDISMPIMDGYEFLHVYHRQPRPHVPVAILSGETDILISTLPPFVIDLIPKPFEIGHLLGVAKKYAQPVW